MIWILVIFAGIVAAKCGIAWGIAAGIALYVLAPYPPRGRG